jgi:hypothetical protein
MENKMKSYLFRTVVGIFVGLIGFTPIQSFAQRSSSELVATQKSNPDLEFVDFISGVKAVFIHSTSDWTNDLYDANDPGYLTYLSGVVQHLNLDNWRSGPNCGNI